MQDLDIEAEIKAKNLTAPRVTKAQIDELMMNVIYHWHVVPDTTTIVAVAVLVMENEQTFTLATDYSACASPENFDEEIGRNIACDNAAKKAEEALWLLEGYALKKRLVS